MKAKKKLFVILLIVITLVITVGPAKVSNQLKQSGFRYIVQDGDTCGKIAASFSVSVISIVKANQLRMDCRDIYAGQVLSIPSSTPIGSSTTTSSHTVVECEHTKYTVVVGDTLDSIATQYAVSRETIYFFNGLDGDIVEPKMQLIIPLCYNTSSP